MEKMNFKIPGTGEQAQDLDRAQVELGRLRAAKFNSESGNLPGPDCPKCNRKGVIAVARADGSLYSLPCSCAPTRAYVRRMETSGLRDVLNRFTFETYQAVEPWQKDLKEKAMNYANNPDGWLFIGGQSGCGKTHLCTAVCNELLRLGGHVVYMPWREEVEKLKDYSISGEARAQLKSLFMNAPVLFIDDLYKCGRAADGTYTPSGADVGIAYDIINYRWAQHLPTIISTERSTDELVAIDEATGSRIAERAGRNRIYVTKKPGRNYRLRTEVNI